LGRGRAPAVSDAVRLRAVISILLFGYLSDHIGRKNLSMIGAASTGIRALVSARRDVMMMGYTGGDISGEYQSR
jgi:MFS family permease